MTGVMKNRATVFQRSSFHACNFVLFHWKAQICFHSSSVVIKPLSSFYFSTQVIFLTLLCVSVWESLWRKLFWKLQWHVCPWQTGVLGARPIILSQSTHSSQIILAFFMWRVYRSSLTPSKLTSKGSRCRMRFPVSARICWVSVSQDTVVFWLFTTLHSVRVKVISLAIRYNDV